MRNWIESTFANYSRSPPAFLFCNLPSVYYYLFICRIIAVLDVTSSDLWRNKNVAPTPLRHRIIWLFRRRKLEIHSHLIILQSLPFGAQTSLIWRIISGSDIITLRSCWGWIPWPHPPQKKSAKYDSWDVPAYDSYPNCCLIEYKSTHTFHLEYGRACVRQVTIITKSPVKLRLFGWAEFAYGKSCRMNITEIKCHFA